MAWSAGQVLTAANLNLYLPQTGSAFTPAYTNLTLGNGSNSGRWCKVGPMIHASYFLQLGTTTTINNTLFVDVPVAAVTGSMAGTAIYVDAGTRDWIGALRFQDSDTVTFSHTESGNSGVVNATNPFTFGTADIIYAHISYFWA